MLSSTKASSFWGLVVIFLTVPGVLLSAITLLRGRKSQRAHARFPGPKQYPIVGRVHDVPRISLWLKFKEWAEEYGPIYETRALGQTYIIVSDESIADELLVKRGHIYSGRPQIRSLFRHKEGPAYSALDGSIW